MDKVMEKKGILSRLKQLMNQISSDFKQKDRTTRINELTSHSLREANRMVVSMPQTTGSDSVGDILNDWNESSFEQNESDTSKNQDGSFEKYVVKSNGSDNEKGNVSDDEGFSGSNAAEGFNSSRNQDSKKRRKVMYPRNSTPKKENDSVKEENPRDRIEKDYSNSEKFDELFFQNLVTVHEKSEKKISPKRKLQVIEEINESDNNTSKSNKNRNATTKKAVRRSDRIRKPTERRIDVVFVTSAKLYKSLHATASNRKQKRKSSSNQKNNTTSSSNKSRKDSVLEPSKKRKLYSEDNWVSSSQFQKSLTTL